MSALSNRRKRIVGIVAMALVGCLMVLMLAQSGIEDPLVNGKRLSKWLEVYPLTGPQPNTAGTNFVKSVSVSEREDFYRKYMGGEKVVLAFRALQSSREAAFPLLLHRLERRPSKIERWANSARWKLAERETINPPGAFDEKQQSITAFLDLKMLDCDFTRIIPELERLAKGADTESAAAAQFLLRRLGKK